VNAAIAKLRRIREAGEKRLGVFWHTPGSGKSLSMLWFTQKVLRHMTGSWTFVMVTDRTELDVQLHAEFADAGAIPAEAQVHAETSGQLRELLAADHRYVFTLIHKFRLDRSAGETTMPVLSDRSDVIVITDEAHRSQYDTLALNMRRALPNAAFMGFTGTPLIEGEELTRQQFGDYVDGEVDSGVRSSAPLSRALNAATSSTRAATRQSAFWKRASVRATTSSSRPASALSAFSVRER
jgi:type I restriction enzyme R subunit